jgi:hypothetical protein
VTHRPAERLGLFVFQSPAIQSCRHLRTVSFGCRRSGKRTARRLQRQGRAILQPRRMKSSAIAAALHVSCFSSACGHAAILIQHVLLHLL